MFNQEFDFKSMLEEIKRKQEGYKQLKNKEIKLIPDTELKEAVMGWMMGKVNNDWPNEYEIINQLPIPCQAVYSTTCVMNEILNGGLNQLFFNSTVQFGEMAFKGYLCIELPRLSETIEKAVQIYVKNQELLESYDDGTLERFSASYEERLFDDLDKVFGDEQAKFEELVVEFIRKYEGCFGEK